MTQITLPPVFAINESFRGNTTQQLLIRETTIEGTIANYQANRFKSKVIVPRSPQDERILLVDRASSVANNLARTIRVSPKKLSDDAALSHLSQERWIAHPELIRQNRDALDRRGRLQAVIDSWRGAFSYIAEEPEKGIKGLRTPQIGAVHIIHGHWTVSKEIGTIVMPTGTGKTETMLSVLVSKPCPKVLVVVPTDALRTQLANKFLTLGILKDPESRVLSEKALYPVVGILRHKPRDFDEVDTFFGGCHVIVTTSHIAGQCTEQIQERIALHCPFLSSMKHIMPRPRHGDCSKRSSIRITSCNSLLPLSGKTASIWTAK